MPVISGGRGVLENTSWPPVSSLPGRSTPFPPPPSPAALTFRALAHQLKPPLPTPGSSPFTPLPTRRKPGNGRRWSLGFVGKEVPIIAFIRLAPAVSLPFDCCRPHTHSVLPHWDRPVWSCRLTYNKSTSLIKGITSIFWSLLSYSLDLGNTLLDWQALPRENPSFVVLQTKKQHGTVRVCVCVCVGGDALCDLEDGGRGRRSLAISGDVWNKVTRGKWASQRTAARGRRF